MATPSQNFVPITAGLSFAGLSNTEASLIKGGKWGGGYGTGAALTYSFPGQNGSSAYQDYYYGTSTEWGSWFYLNSAQVTAIERAIDVLERSINISFTRVADDANTVGELRFAGSNYVDAYAHAYSPDNSAVECGDVWFSYDWLVDVNTNGAAPGSYEFATILHEIGHALGLKHPFDPGNSGQTLSDPYDHYQFTQMSYDTRPGAGGADTWADMYPTTLMISDLIALETLYGAPTSANLGKTTYHFYDNQQYWQTVVDSGGVDTIVYHSTFDNCRIDLSNKTFSQLGRPIGFGNGDTLYNNVALGPSTVIEHATGGGGYDILIGNGKANRLTGNGGNDKLTGGGGNDILNGGTGSDKISGGNGKDTIFWGAGDSVNGAGGTDTLKLTTESLNLTLLSRKVLGIEQVDMRGGIGATLTLNAADVLELSDSTNTIRILGDLGDTVDITQGFNRGGVSGGFRTYKLGSGAVLTVETDVLVV